MFKYLIFLITLFYSLELIACDCECNGDCSFSKSSTGGFVALVKIIEYSKYSEYKFNGEIKKMPLAMKAEIIKKYKGEESREIIQIWGDNGALCRPYTDYFKIGKHYLIAPNKIWGNSKNGKINDYSFSSCFTDFLDVDLEKKMVYGEYAPNMNEIPLNEIEEDLKK
ncbi:hypothetical protein [Aquimarina litoralis]|uniref:hypothetical protein n=1 Tax=Aquimarina litoralis TaxID=584605 RepID=UPI001C570665|nr:hypothetical protein [Aquimarina litoralis]MBW1294956.1 hypothetical protein [Aquimarina litoralis]